MRSTIPALLRQAGMALGAAIAAFALITPPTPTARSQVIDQRFGLIEPHDAPERADELGVGWGRARFHWGCIQPDGPDQWVEAELTGDELAREMASGREVIGLLIGMPDWARDADGLPRGLYLPIDDPGNTWAGFVRQAVTRYRGQIDHWIVWNEPDVWDPDHPGYTWPGDEADYVQLLSVAYRTAKESNPEAVIHLAAVSHWWDALHDREPYFSRLLDVLVADPEAAKHDYYYDAATLHLYFNPASVYELLELYSQMQAEHGIDKPIWLIETNAAPSSDPAWVVEEPTFRISLLEQAAYMPQGLSLALAGGAERVGIYKLIDTPGDYAANPEPFGLLRGDDSPRPAYRTAQVAIAQLAGAEQVTWTEQHVVAQVVIEKPGQVTRLLWSRVPFAQTVRAPALDKRATLMDMWGNASTVTPVDGAYTVTLLGGECQQTTGDYCMIGGPPVYLIEEVSLSEEEIAAADLSLQIIEEGEGAVAPMMTRTTRSPVGGLVLWVVIGGGIAGAGIIGPTLVRRRLTAGRRDKNGEG
jgi:hypothetical protein